MCFLLYVKVIQCSVIASVSIVNWRGKSSWCMCILLYVTLIQGIVVLQRSMVFDWSGGPFAIDICAFFYMS